MYTSIVQNFVKKLIENEFSIAPTFRMGVIEENSIVILLKQESPILYVVSVVNSEKTDLQNHEIFMNEYLQHLQKKLSLYYCSTIIALTLVVGEYLKENTENKFDTKQSIEFVTKKEMIPEENCYHAWWYLSEKRKLIEMEKSQPKNILHLKQIALDSLKYTKQNEYSYSFDEITMQAKQKGVFDLKSSDILLTWNLLCINCFVFFVFMLLGMKQSSIMLFGAEYQVIFDMHEYYRIITYAFIHTNVVHLIQNSVYLYFFGMRTELLYGKIDMTIIYFFAIIGSSILSVLCNDAISVGASGAIFGLIGAVLVYSYKHGKKNIGMNYMTLLLLIILSLIMGVFQKNVDYFGHFGGFITGSLVAWILLKYKNINIKQK